MKTIHILLFALTLSSFFISCSKDDEGDPAPTPITAQLFDDTGVMENSETIEFKITFDQPASTNGYIIVGVTSTNDEAFQTLPATIDDEMEVPVAKGSRFATIRFSPQDNQVLEENAVVTFQLLERSEGINFGSKRTTTIEITDNEAAVSASFSSSKLGTAENSSEGVEVRIVLSAPAPGTGNLLLQLQGGSDASRIDTYPALDSENKLSLPIASGTLFTTFRVYPKDNSILENHQTFSFSILETDGVVIKGNLIQTEVVVLDDEIQGKLKSVETISNGLRTKKTWEYRPDGKTDKILWENTSAQLTNGTNYYHYDIDGKVLAISGIPGEGENFIWENGKVVLSEKISGFFKIGYSTYEYDTNGKIQKKTEYSFRIGGEYAPVTLYQYEYFPDGDMKKQSTYLRDDQAAWKLNASLEYSSYSDKMNPAPMEIIPTFSIQQHLPGMSIMQGDGLNMSQYYSYEFNPDGQVTKRTTIGEVTTYSYY